MDDVESRRLLLVVLVVGCSARPLAVDAHAPAGAGGGVPPAPGGTGAGEGGAGGAGATGGGGAVETGCANVAMAEDCPGVETLSLLAPMLADYGGDPAVSAGEAGRFSITLEAGDQAFPYPSIGFTSDNPLVTIAPAVPQVTVFSLEPHLQITGAFDFLVDPSVAPGTPIHFTACPARASAFCHGGQRASFDLIVQPKVAPTWTTASGRGAQPPSCGTGTSSKDRLCAGLDQVTWSNPRVEFWQIGSTFGVTAAAWLTSAGTRDQPVCATIAVSDRTVGIFAYVTPGKSTLAPFPGLVLNPAPSSGTTMHFVAWTGDGQAACDNVNRIEFDAVVP